MDFEARPRLSESCEEVNVCQDALKPYADNSQQELKLIPVLLDARNMVKQKLPDDTKPPVEEEIKGEEGVALMFGRPDSGRNSPRHGLKVMGAPGPLENAPEQAVAVQQEADDDVFSENSYDPSDLDDPIVNQVHISEVQKACEQGASRAKHAKQATVQVKYSLLQGQ